MKTNKINYIQSNFLTHPKTNLIGFRFFITLLLLIHLSTPIHLKGQEDTDDLEGVYLLSPFTVSGDEDQGYLASSSLIGTRIRSDLKNTGSAIQVLTSEMMEELGATDLNDLLTFATGTESAGLSGNFSGADFATDDRVSSDEVIIDPGSAHRVRGLDRPDRTRNFFLSRMPVDSYNTDRVEVNRGANAILFGSGSPAGIINSSSIKPRFGSNDYVLRYQISKENNADLSDRASFDANQTIIEDRIAIRIAALQEHRNYQQEPSFRDQQRFYTAAAVRPWNSGLFNISFEKGTIKSNNPDPLSPLEDISAYLYQIDEYHAAAALAGISNTNLPLYHDGFNTFIKNTIDYLPPDKVVPGYTSPFELRGANLFRNIAIVYDDLNSPDPTRAMQTQIVNKDVLDKDIFLAASGYPLPDGYQKPNPFGPGRLLGIVNLGDSLPNWQKQSVTDLEFYNFAEHLLAGTAGRQDSDLRNLNLSFEQTFLSQKLGFEIAYFFEEYDIFSAMPFRGRNGRIRVDLNKTLPTGGINPNFGRPYVVDRINLNNREFDTETYRATIFGMIDFHNDVFQGSTLGRLLGEHTFTAVYSRQKWTQLGTNRLETWISATGDPETNAFLEDFIGTTAFQRQVAYLTYLGPPVDLLSDPAALEMRDFVILPNPITVQNIPAPGSTFGVPIWSQLSPVETTYELAREAIVRGGNLNESREKSYVVTWQGRWFEDTLVTIMGLRHDKQESRVNGTPPPDPNDNLGIASTTDPEFFNFENVKPTVSERTTPSYSVVLRPPLAWRTLPYEASISLFASYSENAQPTSGRLDTSQNELPSPKGETKEFGFNLGLFRDKFNLRVNFYESNSKNATNFRLGQMMNSAIFEGAMVAIRNSVAAHTEANPNLAENVYYDQLPQITNEIAGLFGASINLDTGETFLSPDHPYAPTWEAAGARITFDSNGNVNGFDFDNPSTLSDTQDIEARGIEVEFTYNPMPNWRMHLNLAKQETVTTNSLPVMTQVLRDFGPVMFGTPDNPSFISTLSRSEPQKDPGQSPASTIGFHWQNNVLAPYFAVTALDGTSTPEIREWRLNFITNYSIRSGPLRGLSLGGNLRWQDKVAIGYPLITDDFGNAIPDVKAPYFGPSEVEVGVNLTYRKPLFDKRIVWRIALNIQNLFADSAEIIPVLAQPNGDYAQVRVSPPQRIILTNTFNF